ncbi:MAG: glycoside hydrolase family 3 N-terminal domain-containing protein [Acutalibacteraceae bacterium]
MKFHKSAKVLLFGICTAIMLTSCGTGESTPSVVSTPSAESAVSQTESVESSALQESSETSVSIVPQKWQDNGIFSAYYEDAYTLLESMSIEEKVGQMIFASCPTDGTAVELAQECHLGGYVLFWSNFKDLTTDEVKTMLAEYKSALPVNLALAVDEEGGTVVRVSSHENLADEPFASPREIYAEGGLELLKDKETEKAVLLNSLGIDINLAPVCDIATEEGDFMYDRSLGENADITAEFVAQTVDVYQTNNVSATLKHFPGYGGNTDTHTGTATDTRPYSDFVAEDFKPFQSGIDSGANFVMVSHNIVTSMDTENPSSLSAEVHRILREDLGFTGLITTDDLSMGAIADYNGDPFVAAVLAGNDIIMTGEPRAAFQSVITAVEDGTIDEELINHAVFRILAWKLSCK